MSAESKTSVSNLLRQYRFKKSAPATATNGAENQPLCKFYSMFYIFIIPTILTNNNYIQPWI